MHWVSGELAMPLYPIVTPADANKIPYPWVWVNEDGSVRELHSAEKEYLETPYHPCDGGRPYTKLTYDSQDGWGGIGGFCLRTAIPKRLPIGRAPEENPIKTMTCEEQVEELKELLASKEPKKDQVRNRGAFDVAGNISAESQPISVVSSADAKKSPYPWVYVNSNGTVRELDRAEKKYLETEFLPYDGCRPYCKPTYGSADHYGDISGFCRRSAISKNKRVGRPSANKKAAEPSEKNKKTSATTPPHADSR
jgi:hypothetical protein